MFRNIVFGRSSQEDLGTTIDPDKIDFAPACDQLDSIKPQDQFNLSHVVRIECRNAQAVGSMKPTQN